MRRNFLKYVAGIMLVSGMGFAAGCSETDYTPIPEQHPFYRDVRFTDNGTLEEFDPEIINVDASQQTVELSVKESELPLIEILGYFVGEWDEQRNTWRYVNKSSDTGYVYSGDFYKAYLTKTGEQKTIKVHLDTNDTGTDRHLMFDIRLEQYRIGLVEIVQAGAKEI
ncbi:MAG: hypothetical protein NC095_00980 [Muribaculum sp.]|nr:hypothetical protein [Muribaculum sp.]